MDKAEAAQIVNEAIKSTFIESVTEGNNGQRPLKSDALDILRQATIEFGKLAENPELHNSWDGLIGFAGQLGKQAGISMATDMWFQMGRRQLECKRWVHKGLPLFRLWGFHRDLNQGWQHRRYALMTLIEDALRDEENGKFTPVGSAYTLAQFEFGLTREQLDEFAVKVKGIVEGIEDKYYWTEIILEKLLKQDVWTASFQLESSNSHHSVPIGSPTLVANLLNQSLRDPYKWKEGESLEIFASMAFGSIPGAVCRRDYKGMFQLDVLVDLVGSEPLSKRFGQSLVVECKDWSKPADIGVVAKLVATLNLAGCRTGVVLSNQGITGDSAIQAGTRVAIASFLKLGVNILILDKHDVAQIENGRPVTEVLVQKQIETQAMA